MPFSRTAGAIAVHLVLAVLCACVVSSCVTEMPRLRTPANVEAVALGRTPDAHDLLLVEIVWSVVPSIQQERRIVSLPQSGTATQPLELRPKKAAPGEYYFEPHVARTIGDAPLAPTDANREFRLAYYRTSRWTKADRAEADLVAPEDLPTAERRDYTVRNVRTADGGIDLEFERTRYTTDGERIVEFAGRARLPAEMTPPDVAPVWLWLMAVPVAAFDLVWVPVASVAILATLPFGSVIFFDSWTRLRWSW